MQSTVCKNCSNLNIGNYCPECGQKARTAKIDIRYLQEEAKYTFFHINSGFFYTLKQLLTRPGHMIREYIEGHRVKHYKPLLLLFVLAGVYGFLLHYIDIPAIMKAAIPENKNQLDLAPMFRWMTSNYSLVEIMLLPLVSFCSWLAFRKWGYNFIEHIILNAYAAGLRLTISILFFPLMLTTTNMMLYSMLGGVLSMITYLATGWTYVQFFSNRPLGETIIRVLAMIFLIFLISAIGGFIGITIYILYFHK
ncbi:MAG: DUF3667 domain-containing protein [Flavobacterium sp.]|nr:DUF3667 domain-containing protein [Flavobacterium sp.]